MKIEFSVEELQELAKFLVADPRYSSLLELLLRSPEKLIPDVHAPDILGLRIAAAKAACDKYVAVKRVPYVGWHAEEIPVGMRPAPEKHGYIHDTGKGLEIQMVYVPPGSFIMGSKDDGRVHSNETPQHTHPMPYGYYIGRFPTTWGEYKVFCSDTGRSVPSTPGWGIKDDHPVVNVTWDDAVAFCTWAGLSLPTEAEWEKAARGPNGRKFPWGKKPPTNERCHFNQLVSGTDLVGSTVRALGTSFYGVYDMAGNVCEWCLDFYKDDVYERYELGDASLPISGSYRVSRGGSWHNVANNARCANRYFDHPSFRSDSLGLRPARIVT